jgi:ribosomal protein S18 acetylase RimI-like enzyme
LPALECVAVTDPASRAAFGELTSICFDIPFSITKAVYLPERAWQGVYRGFVGWVEGKPVSMVATVVCGGVIGIYSLGTLPQHRNRGYGESLLRAAVRQCPPGLPLVLESTAAGYPLYRRLGFREVGKFTVYLTR